MRDEVARALATRALEVAQKAKTQRGEKGEKGDAGEIIVQPNKGDQGERGPIGPQGIPGKSITGAKGDKGDKGDIGQKGDKGDQGNSGKDGAKGDRGERGFTGVKGIDGVQGPIGPMPRHEKKGLMLRFEKEPGTWGEWIVMPTSGGGGGGRDDKLTDRQKELIALVDAYNLQSANPGKYLKTNGTTLSWDTLDTSDITGLGTMSIQNANAVAITGGTINGTTVGATTPAAGTFTTITGQTGRLNGTGQNYFTYSQTFQNAIWTKQSNVTATDNTTVAPDATTTAATIAWGSASNATGIYQIQTVALGGSANIKSIYIRADVAGGTVEIQDPAFGSGVTTVTLTTSWQRATLTESAQTGSAGIWVKKTASSPSTIYIWGAQLERGSTANTYIPTTTTAVYGTPTLSFSGVSTLGLESNGALFLQPAGTGALQAQATTSSTVGGNARGANAVDWQTIRGSAGQVASGAYATTSGGYGNTASSFASAVSGGSSSQAINTYAFVGGGATNIASGVASTIVGGYVNGSSSQSGYFNFIGGGATNTGTATAAVTTQSGTMNATTAVTLSGSNANIKVGQLITGTSISSYTYVAAISGTALTLSVAASGSSTSTLSFYTPHGVVVGGGNNQATGSYSFIGGGGDAGTAANRNVASGDWSFVGGGRTNTASGLASFVGGGGTNGSTNYANTASGLWTVAVGGLSSNATGTGAFVGGGFSNTANGQYSSIVSGSAGTTRNITGNSVFPACLTPISSSLGVSQSALLILAKQTTDATATVITSDGAAGSGTNQVILPNNSAYFFTGEVVSGVTGGGNTKGWTIEGVIKRGANAASTALVGTPTVTSMYADVGAATWAIAVTADTTNGGIRVTFTGQAATTIRTVCQIRTTEMTY